MEYPAGFSWPTDKHGMDLPLAFNEALGIDMCRDCWNQNHHRSGCTFPGCQCGCYIGRADGLRHTHKPVKGCEEQASLPDEGTIEI